jgi:hypothetical protein
MNLSEGVTGEFAVGAGEKAMYEQGTYIKCTN